MFVREKLLKHIFFLAETRKMWVCQCHGGVTVTHVFPLPSPLFSVESGEGINHGTVCFGVGNLSNRFQDQEFGMKRKLKAIEEMERA